MKLAAPPILRSPPGSLFLARAALRRQRVLHLRWGRSTAGRPEFHPKFSGRTFSKRVRFDGTNIWVANTEGGTVTRLQASDGTPRGTFSRRQGGLYGVLFDGSKIWVSNSLDDTAPALWVVDGKVQGTFPVGDLPRPMAFDVANVWVVNEQSRSVTKLRAPRWRLPRTFSVGYIVIGITFDGRKIWVGAFDGTIWKSRASDVRSLASFKSLRE